MCQESFNPSAVMMAEDRRARRRSWSSCRRWCRRLRSRIGQMDREPVRMSCIFTASPAPADGLTLLAQGGLLVVRLMASECRSSTSLATTTLLAFCQGPLPIRSRALTPGSPPGALCSGRRANWSGSNRPLWRARGNGHRRHPARLDRRHALADAGDEKSHGGLLSLCRYFPATECHRKGCKERKPDFFLILYPLCPSDLCQRLT